MKAVDCLVERRSVRKFLETPISEEEIRSIIELSRYSPSWKNAQAVRYHVVTSPTLKDSIGEHGTTGFVFNGKTIQRCAALVILTVVENLSGYGPDGSVSTSKGATWEMFDAGIAAQSFCLSAHAKGLGTVILGIFDDEKIKEMVNIPQNQHVAALIAVGHAAEPGRDGPPRLEVDELLSFYG